MQLSRNNRLINKRISKFLLPAILMSLSMSVSGIIDGMIVGNMLGELELAAVNVCLPVLQLFATVALIIGRGAANRISIYNGGYEKEKSNGVFSLAVILTLTVSVLFVAMYCVFGNMLISFMSTDDILPYAAEYFRIISLGAPVLVIVNVFVQILMTEGMEKYSALIVIVANVVNVIFDVILIGPFAIAGAASACIIGYGVGVLMVAAYFFFKKRTLRFNIGGCIRYIGEIFGTGIASALGTGLVAVKFFFINKIVMLTSGSSGMVALSLCMACLQLFSMVINGVSQGMSPVLGIFYGEKDAVGVRMIFRRTFVILLLATAAIVITFEAVPQIVPLVYGISAEADTGIMLSSIRLFTLGFPGIALSYLLITFYSSTENGKKAVFVSVIEGIAAIVPLTLLFKTLWGLSGIWIAFIVSESIAPIIMTIWVKGKTDKIYSINGEPAVFEFTVDMNNISDTVGKTVETLKGFGLGNNATIVGVAIEEAAVHTKAFNSKLVNMDVIIKQYEDSVAVSFCDDGDAFDPVKYVPEDEEAWDNVTMLKKISTELKYQYVIGLNKTVAIFANRTK